MANLTETTNWEEGIYQIETTDPVVGGVDGISNKQAKQLANRTGFLKAQIDLLNVDKANFATKTELNTKLNANANAVSATKLQTARTINGVAFDGTRNITIADNTKLPLATYNADKATLLSKSSIRTGTVTFSLGNTRINFNPAFSKECFFCIVFSTTTKTYYDGPRGGDNGYNANSSGNVFVSSFFTADKAGTTATSSSKFFNSQAAYIAFGY